MWTPCQGHIKKKGVLRNGKCNAALPVFSRRGEGHGKADWLSEQVNPEFGKAHFPKTNY